VLKETIFPHASGRPHPGDAAGKRGLLAAKTGKHDPFCQHIRAKIRGVFQNPVRQWKIFPKPSIACLKKKSYTNGRFSICQILKKPL
jgi:hypothetical protein